MFDEHAKEFGLTGLNALASRAAEEEGTFRLTRSEVEVFVAMLAREAHGYHAEARVLHEALVRMDR